MTPVADQIKIASGSGRLIRDKGVYHVDDLVLVPRAQERVLAYIYYRLESENLLPIVFHEGVPSLMWFLQEYMAAERTVGICFIEDERGQFSGDNKRYNVSGMGWINKSERIGENFKKAEVGFAFFRHQPTEQSLTFGKMLISWVFENLVIDTLYGVTPVANRAAIFYGDNLGFSRTAAVDGYTLWQGELSPAVIQSMTKTKWKFLGWWKEA